AGSGNTVTFGLLGGLSEGTHVLHIAAGAVRDVEGSAVQEFSSTFILDLTPPRVVASSVQQGDVISLGSGAPFTYTVTFSKPMKASSLSASAFTLVGTATGPRTPTGFSLSPDGTMLTINYAALPPTEDTYTLTLPSAPGGLESLAGWRLDGETTVGGVSRW